MRQRLWWLGGLPVAAIFVWLGLLNLDRYPLFTFTCFLGAILLVAPTPVRLVLERINAQTGWRYRAGQLSLAALGVILIAGMCAFFTAYSPPPGSR